VNLTLYLVLGGKNSNNDAENIKHHSSKSSYLGDQAPEICALLTCLMTKIQCVFFMTCPLGM
jgi:hypothetical protein